VLKRIKLEGWRQFRSVVVDCHPRLTILTGANSSGKTTILNLVGRHFGWQWNFVSTPTRSKKRGLEYFADFWRRLLSDSPGQEKHDTIGEILYGDGKKAQLKVPSQVGSTYQISLDGMAQMRGLHIPSHRPIYQYQQVANIPTQPRSHAQVFQAYSDIVRTRMMGGHAPHTPNHNIKEALISFATFGYGNQVVASNEESIDLFERFEGILRVVLPTQIGFRRISIRIPEVVLETDSGDFSLDAVSGGVASIIDMAWQIFMYSPGDEPFVVVIDEPENHLHPELQRTLLSNFLSAFPKAQFLVATHNPFIVGSVPESNVYVFRFDSENKVVSSFLESANRSGTSNEILRDVLGLTSATPVWVERRLRELIETLADRDLTEETFTGVRRTLEEIGLGRYVPETLADIVGERRQHD